MSKPRLQQLYTRMKTRLGTSFASFPFVGMTVGLGIGLLVALLWQGPQWFVAGAQLSDKERLELIDKTRGTLAQIFAGLGIAVGLYFTWRRIAAAERTVQVTEEGQITERSGEPNKGTRGFIAYSKV